jgi:hypothetical protein
VFPTQELTRTRALLDVIYNSIKTFASDGFFFNVGVCDMCVGMEAPLERVGYTAETVVVWSEDRDCLGTAGPVRELSVGPAGQSENCVAGQGDGTCGGSTVRVGE